RCRLSTFIVTILFFFLTTRLPPRSTLFPYTTLFRSQHRGRDACVLHGLRDVRHHRTRSPDGQRWAQARAPAHPVRDVPRGSGPRSEEHTSELQSRSDLVCRLLLEKKKKKTYKKTILL